MSKRFRRRDSRDLVSVDASAVACAKDSETPRSYRTPLPRRFRDLGLPRGDKGSVTLSGVVDPFRGEESPVRWMTGFFGRSKRSLRMTNAARRRGAAGCAQGDHMGSPLQQQMSSRGAFVARKNLTLCRRDFSPAGGDPRHRMAWGISTLFLCCLYTSTDSRRSIAVTISGGVLCRASGFSHSTLSPG